METSFKSRVDQVFGGLLGASLQGISPSRMTSMASPSSAPAVNRSVESWSVSEVAIACDRGRQDSDESSGSDNDEPSAQRYQRFVQLTERARKRRAAEDDGLDDEIGWERARNAKRSRSGDLEEEVSPNDEQPYLDEDDECREMRLMVGMDDTLDYEEEEDEYDKLAVGRDGDGERVYMREIKGAGPMADSYSTLELPNSDLDGRDIKRDSRANHAAAAARLREDDKLAKTGASSSDIVKEYASPGGEMKLPLKGILVSDRSAKIGTRNSIISLDKGVTSDSTLGKVESGHGGEEGVKDIDLKSTDLPNNPDDNGATQNVKVKKVRFAIDDNAVEEKDHVNEDSVKKKDSRIDVEKIVLSMGNRKSRVPDYVLNPSKYRHYTLDWSDEEDQNKANEAAFQATRALTNASTTEQELPESKELPMGITFVKRGNVCTSKVNGEAKPFTASNAPQSQARLSFAEDIAIDSPRTGDSLEKEAVVESKTARIFRRRARDDSEDDGDAEDSAF